MIKLFALDVDGTLTDGGVYLDGDGREFKRFDIQDGMGIAILHRNSVKVAFISGRYSGATEQRASELGIDFLYNGVSCKLDILKDLAEKLCLSRDEIAYAGDDVNDIECIEWSGLGIAVSNARSAVRARADLVTGSRGGYGAVREVCERIIAMNCQSCGEATGEDI